jgi:hypothetical protein
MKMFFLAMALVIVTATAVSAQKKNDEHKVVIPVVQTDKYYGIDDSSSLRCGIKFSVQLSGVTKVELESVDGNPLAGTSIISRNNHEKVKVDEIENSSTIITFNAESKSGFIPGKQYYIYTLPCDLYGGYRLSFFRGGLVAHYFGVHQNVYSGLFISPYDLVDSELIFDKPGAPLVEEEKPKMDSKTHSLFLQYRKNATEVNKQALLDQMSVRYDKVVARKKNKLRELEREAKTQNIVEHMQGIVDEMVRNREVRIQQQFLRFIDPRADDNPNDAWMVLRGASAKNAYIGYAPVTNAEYAVFKPGFVFDQGKESYPVVNITIDDAIAYCDWLSVKDRHHIYRLPNEEEWILGAGHMPKDVSMNSNKTEFGLTSVDAYSQSTGACGGIDFWGNCWEWTSSTDVNGLYIIKGGSWDSSRDECRSERSDVVRNGTQIYSNVGFRIVRTEL